jgi:hypothetical protein
MADRHPPQSPDAHCLLPSWPAFCTTACRIELLPPPVQASDCKTCSEAGLLTCIPLPYKQAAFWTRRPQRPGLHTCTPRRACSTALQQRTSAGWVLLETLHSLSVKLCYSRVIGNSLQFNLLCPSCSDRRRLHNDRRSIRLHEA